VNRLGEERGRVARVGTEWLRDRHDANAEPLAKHLLVLSRLDLVPCEARRVVDEYAVEAAFGGLCH
jgi:hypothetical protein